MSLDSPADPSPAADGPPSAPTPGRIVEVTDERTPIAGAAMLLLEATFDRGPWQPLVELRSEIAEKRLGLLAAYDFHLFAALDEGDQVTGTAVGVYLEGVNAGFITYLAVHAEHRGRKIARALRGALVDRIRVDARASDWDELAWVLGEVRHDNPWLRRLVRERGVIPFDLEYYHPGVEPAETATRYVLYRQPVGDRREELPVQLVRRVLYSIYRRAYRVTYPLRSAPFRNMLQQLEGLTSVGVHPAFAEVAP